VTGEIVREGTEFHACCLVKVREGPRFHHVGASDAQTLERLLIRLIRRILSRLIRDEFLFEDPEQPWLDLEPADTLHHLNAAVIRYRIAVGHGAGGRS
jgi:hypothetical protein